MSRLRGMWLRRSTRFRITSVATLATLVVLVGVAVLTSKLAGSVLVRAADKELSAVLGQAVAAVAAGQRAGTPNPHTQVWVLDTAGVPLDSGPGPLLSTADIRELKAATPLLRKRDVPPTRWHGTVATAPDGSQRLVAVGTGLVGFHSADDEALTWLLLAACLVSAAVALATWLTVRQAMRPVERMRTAAGRLAPGVRLPLPDAHDEIRALAGALNALLARRDEATERLRRFTGDAAHELRSPVASIRVQAEVAVAHPDAELSQEVLAEVVAESQRLSSLVDGLLALARSDAGELPAAEPVDLREAAAAAVRRCPAGGPTVQLHLPPAACWVQAAPSEVELVLDNLLRNAFRHARAHITVTVLAGNRSARLVVDDDGHGVAAEHRERVFDRFYRVQDDRARSSGGSGLGLALVAEVVRRRGGAVRVGESPEGGARFQVTWRAHG
ncbi:sensor histidine kinase [Actinokineospora guangxiensis]|uniref:histidine kinase n=1 Tax=Actinokineospora guangxiensis TaxID=1490288 RepID=A0ABW0ELQ9_9PSEU